MSTTTDLPALMDHIFGYIRQGVAAGFDTPDEMIEMAIEWGADEYEGEEDLVPHARRLFEQVLAIHKREEANWPKVTDCDRLDAAFARLEEAGIVCRQNFSCCGTCGSYEIWEEMEEAQAQGVAVRGYAFYHVQDTESAIEGYGLYLGYGATEEGEAAALAVGHEIVEALNEAGLTTTWNGQWSRRIGVTLDWKRRWPY